jgi:vancomycin resistance protein YoaR
MLTISVAVAESRAVRAEVVDRARKIASGLAFLLALGLAARAGAALARGSTPPPTTVPVVLVGGEGIDGATSPSARAHALAEAWAHERLTLHVGDLEIEGTRAELGGRIDADALATRIERALAPVSLLRAHHAPGPIDLPLDPTLDATVLLARLDAARERIDVRPEDARIDPRSGRITRERMGRRLDVHATLDRVEDALATGAASVDAVIVTTPPAHTAEQLGAVRIDALLGFFETHYSSMPEAADRTFNLRVAAMHVDGTVLMPGDELVFDDVVGERSEVNGFRPAPQIASGEVVDGVGGGTCQVAGTLHAAALFAGLPITERHPHSRPSAYLWMGLDAMVTYGGMGLRFRNDMPFPIVIGMTMEGGVLRAEIRGASRARLVTFARRIDETLPFRVREENDPSLPGGVRVLRQRGVPGFRITRYRTVRDVEHNQAFRERDESSYPPTEEIWRVGTGAPPPDDYVADAGDTHPEYLADAYLSATEGPGTHDAVDTVRTGGASSRPGWTRTMIATGTP